MKETVLFITLDAKGLSAFKYNRESFNIINYQLGENKVFSF